MDTDILLLNGPNLNMLGKREPHIYGEHTLKDVELQCSARATAHKLTLEALQSNHEGVLIDRISEAYNTVGGVIINPGGLTHTSVALRDALAGLNVPIIEVHITNLHARETFRQISFISSIASGVMAGFGVLGYIYAVDAMANMLQVVREAD